MREAKCLVSPEYFGLISRNRGTAADWFNL